MGYNPTTSKMRCPRCSGRPGTLKRLPAGTVAELENEVYKTLSHVGQSFVNIL